MAIAIDSNSHLNYMRRVGRYADFNCRYFVYRACALAIVINDSSLLERVRVATKIDLATREALEWQADQDEDLDEAEVIHHLHQQAKSSPVFENAISRTERSNAITTLVTSCSVQSPPLLASARGRPLSSFRRLSKRKSVVASHKGFCSVQVSSSDKFFPAGRWWMEKLWFDSAPSIIGENLSELRGKRVVWHMQFDIVDLHSPRTLPTWRPGKRRRTTVDPFHQVPAPPEQHTSPGNRPPEAKRFKGVRYPPDRKTWAAEMKPSKYKNKVAFGEFKSQAQAARAIDAAFHYYDKPHLLNFPDTPRILSTRPLPAGVVNEDEKLRFVKEQVKWLASMASALPSSPLSLPLEIPESSSRGCIGDTLGLRTFSESASFRDCGVVDESNDGISQPLPSLHPDALAEFGDHGFMESPIVGAVAAGGIMGSLDEHQRVFEWSSEDALVAPSSSGRCWPGSSVQITHVVVDESSSPVPDHEFDQFCRAFL